MGKLLENIASCVREELWKDEGVVGKTYRRYRQIDDAINVRRLVPRVIHTLADGQARTADEIAASIKPRIALLKYSYGGWGYYYALATLEHLEDEKFVSVARKRGDVNDSITLYELTDERKQQAEQIAQKKRRRLGGS